MGVSLRIIFFIFAAFLIYSIKALGSRCPPSSKVYNKSPVCQSDVDCKYAKVCCPNSYNTKSCTEPAPYSQGGESYKSTAGGPGVYCNGVKCRPYEVCKPDPVTKKPKCQRP